MDDNIVWVKIHLGHVVLLRTVKVI
jgi:hypothetical protein